jgi:hypothetical protein
LEGRGGEGGELSFLCLRPSAKLMAAGNKLLSRGFQSLLISHDI